MQTKTDISYGIIPLRQTDDGGWEVFLIHQFSARVGDTYWTLPKGHPEGEETPVETAQRELTEETGLTVDQLQPGPRFESHYTYEVDEITINKTAAYYLATVLPGEPTLQEAEVRAAAWVPLAQVVDHLDFDTTKNMFDQVVEHLQTVGFVEA